METPTSDQLVRARDALAGVLVQVEESEAGGYVAGAVAALSWVLGEGIEPQAIVLKAPLV